MTYYQINVRDLACATTVEDGAAFRAMDWKEQGAYVTAMKPVLKEFRLACKAEGIQRDFKTMKAAETAINTTLKTRFPGQEFVVHELTPINIGF